MRTLSLALAIVAVGSTLALGAPVGPLSVYLVEPCRLVDTRTASAPVLDTQTRFFRAQGKCGIPIGARGVIANVTVTGATGVGHLVAWDATLPRPGISSINFNGADARANNAILAITPSVYDPDFKEVAVYAVVGGSDQSRAIFGTVHVIIDVTGYLD